MDPSNTNIEGLFGYALHHASFIFKAKLKHRFRAAKIDATPEEFVFLFLIPEVGASQSTLTEKSLKEKTTVTRLIDRLVLKGWVTRVENNKNRREQIITVTSEGWKMKAKMMPIAQGVLKDATKGLDPEQVEISRKVLNRVIGNLTD